MEISRKKYEQLAGKYVNNSTQIKKGKRKEGQWLESKQNEIINNFERCVILNNVRKIVWQCLKHKAKKSRARNSGVAKSQS